MKLLVSWMHELSTYISREFYYVMQDLIHVHGWRHVEPPLLATETGCVRAMLEHRFGEIPQAILFWEVFDLFTVMQPTLRELGCAACLYADDLHQLWGSENMREAKLRAFSLADTVLSPYASVFHDFYPELRGLGRIVSIPHAASPDFETEFNSSPENAILLSGAGGECYPLRGRMKDLEESGRFAIVHQAHPGYTRAYDYATDTRVGPGYARTLNRYIANLTDAATFGYIVAKHFEIPATGSLLMTDESVEGQLEQLGFIGWVNYLPVSVESLEERIQDVLNPGKRAMIDEMRRNGQQLVRDRHRTRDRARLIDETCSGAAL